ncbi:hypothetical protein ABZ153_19210 [Streptomyces sp. NPDC006290]|uniref:hypothetical protein n=1 Tax=Streptomyces sp. NPDC006290 TaxID=3156745 RepID=UPI0033A0D5EC
MSNDTARESKSTVSTALQSTGHPHPLVSDTDREHDEQRLTLQAAGLYVAAAAYDAALRRPNPVATLNHMCTTVAEIMPDVVKVVAAKGGAEFAEALRVNTVAPLLAFTAIETARAEVGPDYGYLFDYLVKNLRAGADPQAVRKAAVDAPGRLRDAAEQARA